MKLHFECNMGASGNMVMAALYELLPDKAAFCEKMEQLGLPGVAIKYSKSVKCGITGTHVSVIVNGEEDISDDVHSEDVHDVDVHAVDVHSHHVTERCHEDVGHCHEDGGLKHLDSGHCHGDVGHKHLHGRRYGYMEILELISGLKLSDKVKEDAACVYRIIGEAEAKVHGTSLDEIHFHEVGSLDAVVDVVGCSLLMEMIGVTDVTATAVTVGFGKVRCEHGILPVPAPATAEILRGIPMHSGSIEGELCTPTGAALLKHFSSTFGVAPSMVVIKIGYGMGSKDFKAANCLRAFLYEGIRDEHAFDENCDTDDCDVVYELSCNLDDMTPEAIGAAFDILLEHSALDVFTTPIMMKKNRPAVMLSCLCREEDRDRFAALLIKHTTTLGVRIKKCHRVIMRRTEATVQTAYGEVRVKKAAGFDVDKFKPEYDDVLAAAKMHGVSFQAVYDEVCSAVRREVKAPRR